MKINKKNAYTSRTSEHKSKKFTCAIITLILKGFTVIAQVNQVNI